MKIKDTVGTDIRKLTFDFPIHSNQDYRVLGNSIKDFKKLTKWAFKSSTFSKDEIIIMFEHPGLYSCELAISLAKRNLHFALVTSSIFTFFSHK